MYQLHVGTGGGGGDDDEDEDGDDDSIKSEGTRIRIGKALYDSDGSNSASAPGKASFFNG